MCFRYMDSDQASDQTSTVCVILGHVESVPVSPFPDGPVDAVGRLASLRVHGGAQQLASDVVGTGEQAGIGLLNAAEESHVVVAV